VEIPGSTFDIIVRSFIAKRTVVSHWSRKEYDLTTRTEPFGTELDQIFHRDVPFVPEAELDRAAAELMASFEAAPIPDKIRQLAQDLDDALKVRSKS
jgi:hypothetical protein